MRNLIPNFRKTKFQKYCRTVTQIFKQNRIPYSLLIYLSNTSMKMTISSNMIGFLLDENSVRFNLLNPWPHKMVKHTQTIRRQQPRNCLSVFDHFVGLGLKGSKICQASMTKLLFGNSYHLLVFVYFPKMLCHRYLREF